MKQGNFFFYLIGLIFSFLLFLFASNALPFVITIILTGLFYLYIYLKHVRNVPRAWLIPPVMTSFMMLIYIWIGSVFIYIGNLTYNRFKISLFSDENLNKANYITIFAICALWLSYLAVERRRDIEVKGKLKFHKNAVLAIAVISIGLYFFGIFSGYVGYASSEDKVGSFSNLISLFVNVSFLALILLYLNSFSKKGKKYDITLLLLICLLVFKGVLAGSKYQMVLPLLYLILVAYYKRGKILNKNAIIGFFLFLLAFMIIPLVRNSLNNNRTNAYSMAFASVNQNSISASNSLNDMLYRITYIPPLALAINYSGSMPPAVKNLWEYIFMSPINAFVPRFINPDKPEVTFGRWFSYNLYGSTDDNSIGATYQGILYMAGGMASVLFGFLLVGVVQALMVNWLFNDRYLPIYLVLFLNATMLPQEPWMYFVGLIQSVLFLLLIYKMLLK